MSERPELQKNLKAQTFREFYYLKEELVAFCRTEGLPVSGGKLELTERIARYLENGEKIVSSGRRKSCEEDKTKGTVPSSITLDTMIEKPFFCSEKHRSFFKETIGKSFSFNVLFQKWLKSNSGKTYGDAVEAYFQILDEKKTKKTTIDKQFEYNSYIRDFFEDNKGKQLADAILCWNYKKSLPGNNRYERSDLTVLR